MESSTIKNHKSQGVTLVELAISLSIIGLLIATIATGYNLVHSAEIRKTITSFTNLKSAIEEFSGQYHYLPGDLPTAVNYFGAYNVQNGKITGANNGDGNSYVNDDEDLYAWEHLNQAKLLPGNFTGIKANNSARFIYNVNAPSLSTYPGSYFRFYDITTPVYNYRGHVIQLGISDNNGLPNYGTMKAKDAYAIDNKLDDGIASTGSLTTINGNGTCVDQNSQYALNSSDSGCSLIFWYKKF